MSTNNDPGKAMLAWLDRRHEEIMAHEKAALKSVDAGDVENYRVKMRDKALNLAAIYDDAKELLSQLPPSLAQPLAADLQNYARGAQTALDLDSVFYMGALLYPDEHKSGEQDNLARTMEKFGAACK